MTFIGKLLVFLNLALSLILATVAFGLYANRLDWTSTPAKGDQLAGLLAEREQEYKDVCSYGLRPAQLRKATAFASLTAVESRRPEEKKWYATQLVFVDKGATDANPNRRLLRDPNSKQPIPVPNKPELRFDANPALDALKKPMQALDFYQREYDNTLTAIVEQAKTLEAAAKRDEVATQKMVGEKGLHNRLAIEKTKQDRLDEEKLPLRTEWINTLNGLQLFQQRRKGLEARIRELGGKVDIAQRP